MFVDFFHADFPTENSSNSQIPPLPRIGGGHHVPRIKHLLSQFGDADSMKLSTSTGDQWSEPDHEEVQTWEGNHIDSEFSEIRVELTGETETSGHTRHDEGNEVVEVAVGWGIEFESTNADIVQSFIVNTECLVGILNELLDYQQGQVGEGRGIT